MARRCLLLLAALPAADACTNLMVSPGASADGSAIISYTCDGPGYATLAHTAAHPAGRRTKQLTRKWCSLVGPSRGEVEVDCETYNTVGLLNEHAVAVGETTFGGNRTLAGSGLLTYYDVMELALERSKTARALIRNMDAVIRQYGYGGTGDGRGEGESFTVADPQEVWHMELMGKGKWSKGAVWVAQRVPDGYVGGHANQARITTFPLNDPENCMYSDDVIDFAIHVGLYSKDAPRERFSFTDAYDPLSFTGARKADARVWSFFSSVAEKGFEKEYEDYALGRNLTRRMPLFVKVAKKVNITDHFHAMRNHYEGTALDDRGDVGAGPYHSVFRPSPSSWESGGHRYVNERHVGVPVAATHWTAQLRPNLPPPIAGLNWFSVDDASFSPHAPFHGGATRVPWAYANGNGGPRNFTFDAAFWVFNMVANFAYYRYDRVAPLVVQRVREYERRFAAELKGEEERALALWPADPAAAVELLTAASEARGNALVKEWLAFYQELFMSFRDGAQTSYGSDWYDRIANETGDRYRVPDTADRELNQRKLEVIEKGKMA